MSIPPTDYLETLRAMRDAIYGHPSKSTPESAEANWQECKEYWARDEAWLREKYAKCKALKK